MRRPSTRRPSTRRPSTRRPSTRRPQYPPAQYPPAQAPALPGDADDEGRSGASLVLTGAARGLMIFAIVWGSVLYVGQSVIQDLVTGHHNDAAAQSNTVISDYSASARTLVAAARAVPNCQSVSCARPYDVAAAASLTSFGDDLRGMDVDSHATSAQQHVESDVAQLSSTLTRLADSRDATAYARTAQRSDFGGLIQTYRDDVQSLVDALHQAANVPF